MKEKEFCQIRDTARTILQKLQGM